MKLIGF